MIYPAGYRSRQWFEETLFGLLVQSVKTMVAFNTMVIIQLTILLVEPVGVAKIVCEGVAELVSWYSQHIEPS